MRTTTAKYLALSTILLSVLVFPPIAHSHCQIPCGIYNDPLRFDLIAEHITTTEKAMKMISLLSQAEKPNYNQLARWVRNKEEHADEISRIVTYYFMAQRIKPTAKTDDKAYNQYVNKLALLHQMLVYSMKSKQTTDLANIEKLRSILTEFRNAYFSKHSNSENKH